MKKRFALLLGVLLVLTAGFAACSQPAATARHMRWDDNGETHTYKISLSDFDPSGDKLFNSYSQKIIIKDSNGASSEKSITCYKDSPIGNGDMTLISQSDELRPLAVDGTYTWSIVKNTPNTWKADTHQIVYAQYETSKLQSLNCLDKLSACIVSGADNPFENNDGRTTLRSETISGVVFNNDENQLPSTSVWEIKGYYIGNQHQGVSEYKYETVYDFENRKASVKINGGEAEERTLNIPRNGACIDSAQLLSYIRSLDKSSAAFASTPTVYVYDVTTDTVMTAMMSLNREFNLILNNHGTQVVASVNAVSATVDGIPFMIQYNLPDVSGRGENGYDWIFPSGSNEKRCKYTTLKFRSGWLSYELQADSAYQQVIDAVKYETPSAE